VLATKAQEAGEETIEVPWRDADVPLSPTGEKQAAALGRWIAEHAHYGVPTTAWSSSYLRARQTIGIALEEAGVGLHARVDERLRDRELGVLDLLTAHGVDVRHPDEAARRRWLGKFYYRPPGGESWADVALRIRSFLRDVDLGAGADEGGSGSRVAARAHDDTPDSEQAGTALVVAHDAVVMLFLYVCGELSEEEILDFSLTHTVTNASVTRLVRPSGTGRWTVADFAAEEHLDSLDVPATEHPGDKDAAIH
jgi:broad specificity phosphatase PhoE